LGLSEEHGLKHLITGDTYKRPQESSGEIIPDNFRDENGRVIDRDI